jgi:DUF177 domain-containing protein
VRPSKNTGPRLWVAAMRIEVERLDERGLDVEHVYPSGDFSLEDEDARLAGDVRLSAHASRRRGEVTLRGSIDSSVELRCDRCLAPVAQPVKIDFKAELAARDAVAGEATGLQDADMDFSLLEGEAIDLDEIVREQILLALPARHLCSDDCKGLCPTCGANGNESECGCDTKEADPRWSALAELKDRKP